MSESQSSFSRLRRTAGLSLEQAADFFGLSLPELIELETSKYEPTVAQLQSLKGLQYAGEVVAGSKDVEPITEALDWPVADYLSRPPSGTPLRQVDSHSPLDQLITGNCIEETKRLGDESVHLILSDIPYGIGAENWDVLHNNTNSAFLGTSPAQQRAGAVFKKRGKPINGWSEADRAIPGEYYDWCMTWAPEWLRLLKPGGSAIVFAGRRLAHRCISAMEDTGFSFKDMLAWMRDRAPHRAQRLSAVFDRRGDNESSVAWDGWRVGNLRPTFEPVLWFTKPYRIGGTLADNAKNHGVGGYNQRAFERYFGAPDNVMELGMDVKEGGLHPTQKPVRLMQALIELTTVENQVVLDPFAGSGSTLVAAKLLNRRYIGIEAEEEYCKVARSRLERDLFS